MIASWMTTRSVSFKGFGFLRFSADIHQIPLFYRVLGLQVRLLRRSMSESVTLKEHLGDKIDASEKVLNARVAGAEKALKAEVTGVEKSLKAELNAVKDILKGDVDSLRRSSYWMIGIVLSGVFLIPIAQSFIQWKYFAPGFIGVVPPSAPSQPLQNGKSSGQL